MVLVLCSPDFMVAAHIEFSCYELRRGNYHNDIVAALGNVAIDTQIIYIHGGDAKNAA